MLILPAKAADTRFSGRFQHWNFDRCTVNSPSADFDLVLIACRVLSSMASTDPSQSVESGAQRSKSWRFQYGNFHGFAMNSSITDFDLVLSDSLQGAVVDGLDESIPQSVESGAQRSNIFCIGYVLLRLRVQSAVVDDRAVSNRVCAVVYVGTVAATKLPLASLCPARISVNWLDPPLTGF